MNDDDTIRELAELTRLAGLGDKAEATLADGREVTVTSEPDNDTRLEESGDWFGELKWGGDRPGTMGKGRRPEGFNGASRKVDTRGGPIWWQPPSDLLSDPTNLAKLEARVRGYFREDWCYVGIVVKVRELPCSCCGQRREHVESLWGIESDADVDYLAETIGDMIGEAALAPHAVS